MTGGAGYISVFPLEWIAGTGMIEIFHSPDLVKGKL